MMVYAVAGCVERPPLARLPNPTPIALVVLADEAAGTRAADVPAQLAEDLRLRNLVPAAAPAAIIATLADTRETKARVEALAKALGPDHLFLLVELRAMYFAQMQGAWKWNVDATVTIARSDDLPHATAADQHIPVFLSAESDGANDAFESAGQALSDRIGQLLDAHFGGQGAVHVTAPTSP